MHQANENEIMTQTVTRPLTFRLTHVDIAEKAEAAAELEEQIREEEEDFAELKTEHKAKVEKLEAERRKIMRTIRHKEELRTVTCTEERDFHSNTIRYRFEGQVYDERAMTAAERQLEMKPVLAVDNTAQATEPTTATDDEVAQVIREETSRHTKHSATDGPTEGAPV